MILRPDKLSEGKDLIGRDLLYTESPSRSEYYICRDIQKVIYSNNLEARLSDATYDFGPSTGTFGFNLESTFNSFVFRPPEYYRKLAQLQSTLVQLQSLTTPLEIYEEITGQEI
jgi:hypothetical protein